MQLLLLLSLFLFSLALGSPSDVLYIKKVNADESQLIDAKDFAGLVNIFTTNATYNPGSPMPDFVGIVDIQAGLAKLLPPGLLTQTTVSTESITLLPPFDEQGAAGTASGVSYVIFANIGQGNLTGQADIIFAKYEDKYVKTADFARYGGWRIRSRKFMPFGKPVGNPEIIALIPT